MFWWFHHQNTPTSSPNHGNSQRANTTHHLISFPLYTLLVPKEAKFPMAEQSKAREAAWLEARVLTPEKIVLAQQALEEIRAGEKVFEAIRHNPLPDGYLSKISW